MIAGTFLQFVFLFVDNCTAKILFIDIIIFKPQQFLSICLYKYIKN